jgi:hypothetical protein
MIHAGEQGLGAVGHRFSVKIINKQQEVLKVRLKF